MIFRLIITAFLFIALISLMYNTIKEYNDKSVAIFATVCAVGSAIVGLFFGLALSGNNYGKNFGAFMIINGQVN